MRRPALVAAIFCLAVPAAVVERLDWRAVAATLR